MNDSVPGSTVHDGLARDWALLRPSHPDVVVLAYGMNDGAPAQFNSGETYAGGMSDLRSLITDIRSSGAVPVILTTPSQRTAGIDWTWSGAAFVPQQSPIDVDEPVREVQVPGAGEVPESARHAAVNAGFRQVARDLDVDLIDVEPFWLSAVAHHGESALFNRGEFVHPSLLGHQLSYHAAIDAWVSNMPSRLGVPPSPELSWPSAAALRR